MILPVNGQDLWKRTECTDLQPPPVKRQPGRPKKKRRLDASELMRDNSEMKRATYGIKCSSCKQTGHNKSTCPLPTPATNQPAPSAHAQATSQAAPSAHAHASSQPAASSQAAPSAHAHTSSQPAPSSQAAPSTQVTPQPSKTQASQQPTLKKKRSPRKRKNVDHVAANKIYSKWMCFCKLTMFLRPTQFQSIQIQKSTPLSTTPLFLISHSSTCFSSSFVFQSSTFVFQSSNPFHP
ncbi:hypothetical protein MTR_2g090645 [Medicago truncatula]|uniref:Transcription factor interactor and regulator CCHC(Zn) family n=1 Tax=Medicago truncatula TaxID=3880 RepID=A0A072VCI9_MEDTR|nr:hypothetical protein MTR_2g090645 [Medicago truncatula]